MTPEHAAPEPGGTRNDPAPSLRTALERPLRTWTERGLLNGWETHWNPNGATYVFLLAVRGQRRVYTAQTLPPYLQGLEDAYRTTPRPQP